MAEAEKRAVSLQVQKSRIAWMFVIGILCVIVSHRATALKKTAASAPSILNKHNSTTTP